MSVASKQRVEESPEARAELNAEQRRARITPQPGLLIYQAGRTLPWRRPTTRRERVYFTAREKRPEPGARHVPPSYSPRTTS